ncbi:UDP-N-acetylglucosamine--N-acetylmuramyl-(pentapeptide) pyrophosphoryl-undecaprenol N-acetylglucosamine transferase [Anaerolineales bacterium]
MRILIGAGGTGGHVYPALAVAEVLQQHLPQAELVFVATRGGFEKPLLEQSHVRFQSVYEIFAGPLHGVNFLLAIRSLFLYLLGLVQSLYILIKHRADIVFLTGGWANVPLALAAWLLRKKIVLYLPDIEPGATIQLIKRFATQVAITVPDSAQYFKPGQTTVTGYPLQRSRIHADRQQALQHFSLDPHQPTLLITGGSRGAQTLNIAIEKILPDLLDAGIQLIHITGTFDWERVQQQTAAWLDHPAYHAYPYLNDEMGQALAAADLVLCRSGASALGELPFFGLPSILVPYPFAWRYQKTNADYLVSHGAGFRLDDAKMEQELLPLIIELMHNDSKRQAMAAAAKSLNTGDGADHIARLLVEQSGGQVWSN